MYNLINVTTIDISKLKKIQLVKENKIMSSASSLPDSQKTAWSVH